jgi:signal transduction histidine kinase
VILDEERRVPRQVVHQPALQGGRKRAGRHQAVPRKDAARLGADHEDGPARDVEEYRVGGLGPDARNRQQRRPERREGLAQEAPEVAVVATGDLAEPGGEPAGGSGSLAALGPEAVKERGMKAEESAAQRASRRGPRLGGGPAMLQTLLSRHLMVLVMLILAGIGWLLESRLDLFEWFLRLSRPYEDLELDGLVPCVLLVLAGAFFDTYRAHEAAVRERERLRIMMEMATTVAHEVNDPLTTIIAHLEVAVEEMDPDDPQRDRLASLREAAWRMASRIRQLTEIREYRPREVGVGPRVLDLPH